MTLNPLRLVKVAAVVGLGLMMTPRADAGLTLTLAGTNQGFTLSTFASGFPSTGFNGVGPISTAYPVGGGVLATSYANGTVIHFATDADNQVYGAADVVTGGYSAPAGLASSNGHVFLAEQGNGHISRLNDNGTFNSLLETNFGAVTGLTADNAGFLYASNLSSSLFKINSTTGAFTTLTNAPAGIDGVGISPDGLTVFGEAGQHIYGYNTTTGAQLFDSGFISAADGAALGSGSLAGLLFVNTNSGNVVEVNLSTSVQTLIASGGSRGDLVSVDPSGNGSLLLSQTDSIVRLSAPPGGGFAATPEPATWVAGLLGAAVVAGISRRRKTA